MEHLIIKTKDYRLNTLDKIKALNTVNMFLMIMDLTAEQSEII